MTTPHLQPGDRVTFTRFIPVRGATHPPDPAWAGHLGQTGRLLLIRSVGAHRYRVRFDDGWTVYLSGKEITTA